MDKAVQLPPRRGLGWDGINKGGGVGLVNEYMISLMRYNGIGYDAVGCDRV